MTDFKYFHSQPRRDRVISKSLFASRRLLTSALPTAKTSPRFHDERRHRASLSLRSRFMVVSLVTCITVKHFQGDDSVCPIQIVGL
jgi:hypothetical protein